MNAHVSTRMQSAASRTLRRLGVLSSGALLALLAACSPDLFPTDTHNQGTGNQGTGLGNPANGAKPNQTAQLRRFTSGDELLRYLKQQIPVIAPVPSRPPGLFSFFDMLTGGAVADSAQPLPLGAVPSGAAGDARTAAEGGVTTDDGANFSSTNLQEEGVDESDVFKTDGDYFYVARGRSLRIVSARPAEALSEIAHVLLDETIDSFYLLPDRLVVLASKYGDYGGPQILIWPPYRQQSAVVAYTIDITDKTTPRIVGRTELDGGLVSSRLVDGRLFLVLAIAPRTPDNPTRANIDRLTLNDVMPRIATNSGSNYLVPVENWYEPPTPQGYYMTAVVSLEAANVENVIGSVAVLAGATTIYATRDSVYVTQPFDLPYFNTNPHTAIHKFALDAGGAPLYIASGEIAGTLLNQFSLSEHEGVLRVAAHVLNLPPAQNQPRPTIGGPDIAVSSPPFSGFATSVYALAVNGEKLEVIGSVGDIAPGEQLYAARFLGARGYLVTFRQVDPLFVLDLADPTAPRVLGELKIPGFSEYLHPVDDTHLIGVGMATETTTDGFDLLRGVQVSLFDVSDPLNPRAIEQLELGGRGSQAEALRTHKGFTFLPASKLLALPVTLTRPVRTPWSTGDVVFDGVIVWQVELDAGFEEQARIAHLPRGSSDALLYGFPGTWGRAAFIDQTVYAVSPGGVRAVDLPTAEVRGALTLEAIAGEVPEDDHGYDDSGWRF